MTAPVDLERRVVTCRTQILPENWIIPLHKALASWIGCVIAHRQQCRVHVLSAPLLAMRADDSKRKKQSSHVRKAFKAGHPPARSDQRQTSDKPKWVEVKLKAESPTARLPGEKPRLLSASSSSSFKGARKGLCSSTGVVLFEGAARPVCVVRYADRKIDNVPENLISPVHHDDHEASDEEESAREAPADSSVTTAFNQSSSSLSQHLQRNVLVKRNMSPSDKAEGKSHRRASALLCAYRTAIKLPS